MLEAINELSLVSAAGFRPNDDDFCDTISMLASLQIWWPSETIEAERSGDSGDVWDLDMHEETLSPLSLHMLFKTRFQ